MAIVLEGLQGGPHHAGRGITGVAAALRKDGGALGDAFGGSSPTGGGAASNAATEANAIP